MYDTLRIDSDGDYGGQFDGLSFESLKGCPWYEFLYFKKKEEDRKREGVM
jgi:hypothetical protein